MGRPDHIYGYAYLSVTLDPFRRSFTSKIACWNWISVISVVLPFA